MYIRAIGQNYLQRCGAGSSISSESGSGSRVLMTQNWRKKIQLKIFFILFWSKIAIFFYVQATGGAFRLQPSKENIQHLKRTPVNPDPQHWLSRSIICTAEIRTQNLWTGFLRTVAQDVFLTIIFYLEWGIRIARFLFLILIEKSKTLAFIRQMYESSLCITGRYWISANFNQTKVFLKSQFSFCIGRTGKKTYQASVPFLTFGTSTS